MGVPAKLRRGQLLEVLHTDSSGVAEGSMSQGAHFGRVSIAASFHLAPRSGCKVDSDGQNAAGNEPQTLQKPEGKTSSSAQP